MSHIEGDGVIEDIYYLLWRKDSPYNERLNIQIPDTVVFRKGRPMAWYFTNSEGLVLRKKQTSLVYEEILSKFTKKSSEGEIVAYFINIDEEKKLEKLLDRTYFDGPQKQEQKERKKELPVHNVEYFGLKEFKHIFSDYKNFEGKTGILQKFIHPYGTNNELIQAIWSPRVCVFTKRVNLRRLNETRFDVYERALTFDGPDFYSKNVPLRGGYIPGKLRATCDNIVRHIAYISYEKISINRLVGYFKVDQNENVWFLWTSSIRINETSKVHKRLSEYVDKPLCLEPCMQTNINIRHIKTNFASRPVTLQMNDECTVCAKRVSKIALIPIVYRLLLGNEEILKRSEQSATQDRLMEAAKRYDHDESKPKTIKKTSIGVPFFIKKLHPGMKLKEFQTLRESEHFLIMKADVCEECYLIVSKEYEGGFPYKLTEAKKTVILDATQSTFNEEYSKRPATVASTEKYGSSGKKKNRQTVGDDDSNDEENSVLEKSGNNNRPDISSHAISVLEPHDQRPAGLTGHKARLYNITTNPTNEQPPIELSRTSLSNKASSSFPRFLNRTVWGQPSYNKPSRLTGSGESYMEETKFDSFQADHSSLKKDVLKVMSGESENSIRFRSIQSANKSHSNTSLAMIPSQRGPKQKIRPQTTKAKESKEKPAKFFRAPKKEKEDLSKYQLDEVPDLFDDSNQDIEEFEDVLREKMARPSEHDHSYGSGTSKVENLKALVAANNVKNPKKVQINEVNNEKTKTKGYLAGLHADDVNAEYQLQDHLDQDMVLIMANAQQKKQGRSLLIRDAHNISRKENASASSSSFSNRLDTQGSSNLPNPSKIGLSTLRSGSAKSSHLKFKKQDTFSEKNIVKELEDKIDYMFGSKRSDYEDL